MRFFANTITAAALLLAATMPAAANTNTDIDVAGFANGGLIESSTSDYPGWEANYLLDESPTKGWASQKDAKGPFTILISLAEKSEIHDLEFDDASNDGIARGSKTIDVFVSDTSATAGFSKVLTASLKSRADGQAFALKSPVTARWIKLVVTSNYAATDYSELMDFRAMGRFLTASPPPAGLSGTYQGQNYGKFHLVQKGAELSGCYEYDSGLVHGGLESHLMRLTWTQGPTNSGPAVMVAARSGKGFMGWWRHSTDREWTANWALTKISNDVGSCANWSPTGSVIADELNTEGRSRLYGINFNLDSAELRADAMPEVNELIGVLKANPSLQVNVDGHTDSTGSAAHNLDLSKRRAAAVVAALTKGGIEASRLTSEGFGQTKPIATNDT